MDYEIGDINIHFLDVDIEKVGVSLKAKVYFKPTDRNSYLSVKSGHHPTWIRNIPKGQIIRVKRNCSRQEDFTIQANFLKNTFVQKGYRNETLDSIISEVDRIPRGQCLTNKDPKVQSNQQWGFISDFHCQYREVEDIFRKYWHILSMDRDLGLVLPDCPRLIYRKAPNFGDHVVKRNVDTPGQQNLHIDKKASLHVGNAWLVGPYTPVIGDVPISLIKRERSSK